MSERFDMADYWLMPHGLRASMVTVFWSSREPGPSTPLAGPRRIGPTTSFFPASVRPFPLLAPGKTVRQVGEHTFWRGTLWGRTVALQGDSSFTKFDLFEATDQTLAYWGTFRGNGYYDSEESHSFSSPYAWMNRDMGVGEATQQRIRDSVFDPRLRRVVNSAEQTLRVEVVAHHPTWLDATSQTRYDDVLEVHYWGRHPDPSSREVYFLGRGLGTIRFETANALEPSGVRYQYAEGFERFTPPDLPAVPWLDPFHNATHVPNGFCEDFATPPSDGAPVSALRGWSGSPGARVTNTQGDEGTGPWKVALGGALEPANVAITDWIPASGGVRYRLSARVLRTSRADAVYLDFDDGAGQGGSFPDAHATATATGLWEHVSAETTVGPTTTALRVRCVREGPPESRAYFDAMTLQRLG